jgi:hypothetical protein
MNQTPLSILPAAVLPAMLLLPACDTVVVPPTQTTTTTTETSTIRSAATPLSPYGGVTTTETTRVHQPAQTTVIRTDDDYDDYHD